MKKRATKVTDLELMILQQIWECGGQLTVNEIIENWPERKKPGYTTILKTLQKMETKHVVGHEQIGKKYAYFTKISKEATANRRMDTIINRMFSGSKVSFVQYFINNSEFDPDELEEIKVLITKKEQEEKS